MQRREEEGPFTSRKQLLKVQKLGPKAFLQYAGFFADCQDQIRWMQPQYVESYEAARGLLRLCGCQPEDILKGNAGDLAEEAEK